jgi:HlyD family secretion protein
LRFKPPEPTTNKTFAAQLRETLGLGKESKNAATNAAAQAKAGETNKTDLASSGSAPLTGSESPEELMRRMREFRDRGEEPPPELRARIGELFRSGAMQRGGGGGPRGEGGGRMGGGGAMASRPRPERPGFRTVYLLTTNAPPGGGDPVPTPQPVRVRTGITDGTYTEITEGLKEGDPVITLVRLPPSQVMTAPTGASPFGGGGSGMRRF